jgi:hypothetical protein
MKPMRLRSMQAILVLVTCAVLLCSYLIWKPSHMTQATPLPPMHTLCMGRFLVDLPQPMEIEGYVDLYYGLDENFRTVRVEAIRNAGNTPSFETLVNKRIAALRADLHPDAPLKNMFVLSKKINEKTVLIRSYKSVDTLESFTTDVFFEKGDAIGMASAHIYETSSEKVEVVENRILRVVEHTQFLNMSNPNQPGTCIGSLVINAGQDGEEFSVSSRGDSQSPDVLLGFSSYSMAKERDGGLFKRLADKAPMLAKLGIYPHELRRGRLTIAGMPAEEILDTGHERKKYFHVFSGETSPATATFATPSLKIDLSTGGQRADGEYYDASWSDEKAISIWDAVLKSMRLRPGTM